MSSSSGHEQRVKNSGVPGVSRREATRVHCAGTSTLLVVYRPPCSLLSSPRYVRLLKDTGGEPGLAAGRKEREEREEREDRKEEEEEEEEEDREEDREEEED